MRLQIGKMGYPERAFKLRSRGEAVFQRNMLLEFSPISFDKTSNECDTLTGGSSRDAIASKKHYKVCFYIFKYDDPNDFSGLIHCFTALRMRLMFWRVEFFTNCNTCLTGLF